MFNIHAVQAHHGDCLLLEYGTQAERRFLLIDGGPEDTFEPHLRSVLTDKVVPHGGVLERVMLSHVDNDHVIGLLDLFADLRAAGNPTPPLVSVGGLWHNSFARTVDPNGVLAPRIKQVLTAGVAAAMGHAGVDLMGIQEGAKLRLEAQLLQIDINPDTADPIIVDMVPAPVQFGNLTLTVVGPTQANLDKLREEWEEWLDTHEDDLLEGDPQALANSDRSIPNLSSICVIAEADGRRALLTGDARSDHLLDGLETLGLLDADGAAQFDLIKLPHHGSDRNATKKFFRKITAERYLVSADGKNDNPDLITLVWIVEAAKEQEREIQIFATNSTPSTSKLLEEYPPQDYGYELVFRPDAEPSLPITMS